MLLGLLIILSSCSKIVESKDDISNFRIEISEFDTNETLLCRIYGNTKDSALWIKSYKLEYDGQNVFVLIEKSLNPTGISDPYFIQFIIPEITENIYLGRKELIWNPSK